MSSTQEFPFALRQYIEKRVNEIHDTNAADHRATSQHEINGMIESSARLYRAGEELVGSLSADEIVWCRKLYARKSEYRGDELTHVRLLGRWVIVPRYITYIEEARELRKIFTS